MLVVVLLGALLAVSPLAQAHHKPDHDNGGGNGADQGSSNGGGNANSGNSNGGGNGNKGKGNNEGHNAEEAPREFPEQEDSSPEEDKREADNDESEREEDRDDTDSDASESHNDDNEEGKVPRKPGAPKVPALPDADDDEVQEEDDEVQEEVDEVINTDEDVADEPPEDDDSTSEEAPPPKHGNKPDNKGPDGRDPRPDESSDDPESAPSDDQGPETQPEPSEDVTPKHMQDTTESLDPEMDLELDEELPEREPADLPFTFWVEGFVVYVLADPIFVDDEMLTDGTYRWDWGDGTISEGDFFQTHHYVNGPDAYSVTLTRFDGDGEPTHEHTITIDLEAFLYEDPKHVFEQTKPLNVQSQPIHNEPTVESDVGQLIATVPVGPLPLFLLSALAMLVGLRRRLTA